MFHSFFSSLVGDFFAQSDNLRVTLILRFSKPFYQPGLHGSNLVDIDHAKRAVSSTVCVIDGLVACKLVPYCAKVTC